MTELNQLAREVYLESKLQYGKGGKLSIHFSDRPRGSCPVSMDKMDLKYVLMNLMTNAIKASGETGDVFLELRNQGWKCAVDIIDYGKGVYPQSFEQVKNMDLSQARSEIQDLSRASQALRKAYGALTLEATPGQGNRVRIELPLAEAEQRQKA